jgi:hypothetical protein
MIKREGSAWVDRQNFWLFGTATYYDGSTVNLREVTRNARYFFNVLDRKIITRRDYNEGNRLQRLVFVEHGKTRTNTHFHFFIKGHSWRDLAQIYSLAPTFWETKIRKSLNLVFKENFGVPFERGDYCWKEFDSIDKQTLLVDCCHLKHAN